MGKGTRGPIFTGDPSQIVPPKRSPLVRCAMAAWRLFHRFLVFVTRAGLDFFLSHKAKSMPPISDPILLESATSLAHKIRTQKLSSVQVIQSFIRRIKEVNPLLNVVVDDRFDEALEDGAKADELIRSGKYTHEELKEKWPFLGVPITTKDQMAVKGLLHTAGIYKRKNIRATEDSDVIARMRKVGAIPLALTNVSECCMWWESVNTIHGRTNNPYNTTRIVGGSSGGEGCLQGCAGSAFGIGSDIGGSIRMPAFFNGIFGHKPTRYVVSIEGQYPQPNSEEQRSFIGVGPMVRYAVDLKPMLQILAGNNAKLLNLNTPVDVRNLNYFYQETDGGDFMVSPVDQDLLIAMRNVIKHLETNLKVKPKQMHMKQFKQSVSLWLANMADNSGVEFAFQLGNKETRINPYKEFLKWLIGTSKHTLVGLLTCVAEDNSVQHGSEKHQYLVKKRDDFRTEMSQLLGDNGVFLYPTHPTVAPYHNEPIVRSLNFGYTGIINVLGFPATTVPLGLGSEGLPLGLQVIANFHQDRLCLAVAEELERAFGGWTPPKILCK